MTRRIFLVLKNGDPTALAFTSHSEASDYVKKANKESKVFNVGEDTEYSLLFVTLYGKVD